MNGDLPKTTVLGEGAMASVCAAVLADNGVPVTIWGHDPEHLAELARTGRNERYLPGLAMPESLHYQADPATAMAGAQLIVSAIPTQFLRQVWQQFQSHIPADVPIISVTKGIENDTFLSPTGIIADILGPGRSLAALSGPNIARELVERRPASACVASRDAALAQRLQPLFTTPFFRIYSNTDLIGVELAGATKNVIALAAGILDGLQAGYNAKSALLARGLSEITRLGVAMGAQSETFFGITGVGDLATTCFCPEGRNRTAGEMLGKGQSLDTVLKNIPGVVEGVPTTRSVMALAKQKSVELPIAQAVHGVLFEGVDPRQAISDLMSRPLKAETIG